jgi:hypothetical protein
MLPACWMLLALVGEPLAAGLAQGPQPPPPPVPPGLDLGAQDPVSVFLARNVNFALAQANRTGGLPPLPELNDRLALLSPLRQSILATLPVPVANLTAPPSEDLLAALANLRSAELNEIYGILEGIGYQLVAAGELVAVQPLVSAALLAAGNELLSFGYFSTALASHVQAEAARHVVTTLQDKAMADPLASDQAAASSTAAATDVALEPKFFYGSWERLENVPSGQRVVYTFTPKDVVRKQSTTLPNGHRATRVRSTPGAVTVDLAYETPGAAQAPDQAEVRIIVDKADGGSMTLAFTYLHAAGDGAARGAGLEVLVEEDGERKAFLRMAN